MAIGRRLLLTLFCLLAFGVQNYVAATHIHPQGTQLAFAVTRGLSQAGDLPDRGKLPSRDGRDDCPLCRVVAHAGITLAPSLLVLEVPSDGTVFAYAPPAPPRFAGSQSHAWLSRAPPAA